MYLFLLIVSVYRGEPIKNPVACLAEIGTIQIEFTRLSEITKNWKYHYVVSAVAVNMLDVHYI